MLFLIIFIFIGRNSIYREISNMIKLSGESLRMYRNTCGKKLNSAASNPNVLQLYDVLEFIQSTKSTIFLVIEIANGGELFDRIRSLNENINENDVKFYFKQLISGLKYCHDKGLLNFISYILNYKLFHMY